MCLPAGIHWRQWGRWRIDGWRMVSAALFPPLCENESINSAHHLHLHPPTPLHLPCSSLPQPSLCLLSLFVSEMIPSVMSKATLSYSCCLGNQRAERQRLKTSAPFEAGKHKRLSTVQPPLGFPAYHNENSLIIISPFILFGSRRPRRLKSAQSHW